MVMKRAGLQTLPTRCHDPITANSPCLRMIICRVLCLDTGTRGSADAGSSVFQQRLLWIANLLSLPSLLPQVMFVELILPSRWVSNEWLRFLLSF